MASRYDRYDPGPMHYEIEPLSFGGYFLKASRYQGGLMRDLVYVHYIPADQIVWC